MVAAVNNDWKINWLDISLAFLQGDLLKREVFVKPNEDICSVHQHTYGS